MTDLQWRVVVAADEAGVSYKDAIKADLLKDPRVKEVIDVGVNADTDKTAYPHVAVAAARKIAAGEADRGILVCGTGHGGGHRGQQGPRHPRLGRTRLLLGRAPGPVERRAGPDLGERVIGKELARRLAKEFLGYVFDTSSASAAKVDAITGYETGAEVEAGSVGSC